MLIERTCHDCAKTYQEETETLIPRTMALCPDCQPMIIVSTPTGSETANWMRELFEGVESKIQEGMGIDQGHPDGSWTAETTFKDGKLWIPGMDDE